MRLIGWNGATATFVHFEPTLSPAEPDSRWKKQRFLTQAKFQQGRKHSSIRGFSEGHGNAGCKLIVFFTINVCILDFEIFWPDTNFKEGENIEQVYVIISCALEGENSPFKILPPPPFALTNCFCHLRVWQPRIMKWKTLSSMVVVSSIRDSFWPRRAVFPLCLLTPKKAIIFCAFFLWKIKNVWLLFPYLSTTNKETRVLIPFFDVTVTSQGLEAPPRHTTSWRLAGHLPMVCA